MRKVKGGFEPPFQIIGFDKAAGAVLNATRKRRGPGGAEGGKPGAIHLPPVVEFRAGRE